MILKGSESYLGVLLQYGETEGKKEKTLKVQLNSVNSKATAKTSKVGIGLIGAGLHSNTGILPSLKKIKNVELVALADTDGYKSMHTGKKYGFKYCVSDYKELLRDNSIDCIMIATRHNLHAKMAIDCLNAGKHVFLEKPLAMNESELEEIIKARKAHPELKFVVGFNRRFSPHAKKAKSLLGNSDNMVINCRVNAGFVPKESWVHDISEGGGRVIGELCHFVDLVQFLSGGLPIKVFAQNTGENGEDNLAVSLKMNNGSIATIVYASQGDRLLPRERIEILSKKSACVIDNFKSLFWANEGKSKKIKSFSLDRGFVNEFKALFDSIIFGNTNPVDFNEYVNTTLITFKIIDSLKTGLPQDIAGV